LGSLDQTPDRRGASGKPGEFVDIVVQKLVLDELGSDTLQNLVNHRPSEEQRRRIDSGEKDTSMGMTVRRRLSISIRSVRESSPAWQQPDDLTSDPFLRFAAAS